MAQNPERQIPASRIRPITIERGVVIIALILLTEADALAYVDPGTGSYLFQLAIAGALAGVYTIRRYWQGLRKVLQTGLRRPPNDPPPDGRHGVE